MPTPHKTHYDAPDFSSLTAPFTAGYPCDAAGHCPFKAIDDDVTDIDSKFCRRNCGLGIKGAAAIGGNYDEIR